MPRLVAKANANRVGTAVCNQRIGYGDAIQNRGGVFGDLGGREAEACGEHGVDREVCGWATEGVFDSVLDVDDARDLFDLVPDAGPEVIEQGCVLVEKLDLDGLRSV